MTSPHDFVDIPLTRHLVNGMLDFNFGSDTVKTTVLQQGVGKHMLLQEIYKDNLKIFSLVVEKLAACDVKELQQIK